MADKKKKHNIIKLKCSVCKRLNYYLKLKKSVEKKKKLELKKFCKWCRKHVLHKESR